MAPRIRRFPRVLALLSLIALPACGWDLGPRTGDAAPASVELVPVRAARAARPDARPASPAIARLPDRVHPDSIGRLLERRVERRLPGVDVDDYLLYLPPGLEKSDGEWPLLLWLHGRSLRGRDLSGLKRYGPPAMIARGQHLPFVVVSPQLPPDGRWADLDPVAEIVEEVAAKYPVDRDRIYLLGFSMGGGGAYRMAFAHAEKFAAMIGIAGHTPPPTAENVRAVASLPFLAIHGENDRRVPLSWGRRMASALATAGAPQFEFRVAPGLNHSQLERMTRDRELYDWLLSHRRAPAGTATAAGR